MTTEVYLIRHGETMFNQLNKVQGWADSPLTIKGINDLKKTAEALSQIHFDNMYSSDLKRAIDTVHLMKNANEVSEIGKIKKLPEFRESFLAHLKGMTLIKPGNVSAKKQDWVRKEMFKKLLISWGCINLEKQLKLQIQDI